MKNKLKAPESVHHEAKYVEEKAWVAEGEIKSIFEKKGRYVSHIESQAIVNSLKDFIATIVKDCKPKVNRIELSNLAPDILDSITTSRVVGLIEVFLKSKDIEVEE